MTNGTPSPTFKPSRDICQVDPLSPFIFILMAEDLGRCLKAVISSGKLHGLSLHDSNHPISHSKFVGDAMLMGTPLAQEVRAIKKVLDDFMDASGMSINHFKSQIFFLNTPLVVQFHISFILGFSRSSLWSKYLGVPLLELVASNTPWEDLLSKLSKKLTGWTFHSINIVSCLTLL